MVSHTHKLNHQGLHVGPDADSNTLRSAEGLKLKGAVLETYLRGTKVFDRSTGFKGIEPSGQLLL